TFGAGLPKNLDHTLPAQNDKPDHGEHNGCAPGSIGVNQHEAVIIVAPYSRGGSVDPRHQVENRPGREEEERGTEDPSPARPGPVGNRDKKDGSYRSSQP